MVFGCGDRAEGGVVAAGAGGVFGNGRGGVGRGRTFGRAGAGALSRRMSESERKKEGHLRGLCKSYIEKKKDKKLFI